MSLRVASRRLLAQPAARATLLPRGAAAVVPLRLAPTSHLVPSRVAPTALRMDSLRSFSTTRSVSSSNTPAKAPESSNQQAEADADADAPPPKASFRERLKFLTKRYGWWALGVYLAASAVDFSLTFLAIHLLGADHIKSLEASVRKSVGLEKRPSTDDEAEEGKEGGSSTIWTEAVLAYTIHKTLLLPFRVMITAAVTPSFVKWLVRMGWARANHVVKADVGRKAADKAIEQVVKRNAAKETVKHQ